MTADAEYVLEGLEGPAEILVDRWGVPHMYASTLYDVFRVQGFNAARDRLWQLDFWRRRGLGLLAEVFGPSMVERDRACELDPGAMIVRGNAVCGGAGRAGGGAQPHRIQQGLRWIALLFSRWPVHRVPGAHGPAAEDLPPVSPHLDGRSTPIAAHGDGRMPFRDIVSLETFRPAS